MRKKSILPYYLLCNLLSWVKLSLKHKNNTSIGFIRPKTIGNDIVLNISEIIVFYKMAVASMFDFGTIFAKKNQSLNFSLI